MGDIPVSSVEIYYWLGSKYHDQNHASPNVDDRRRYMPSEAPPVCYLLVRLFRLSLLGQPMQIYPFIDTSHLNFCI
jgi:hypothetical protein